MKPAHMAFILVAAIAAVGTWATSPGANTIKLETCQPDGIFARLSLSIYGPRFWQAQLDGLQRQIASAQAWKTSLRQLQGNANSAVASGQRTMEEIYQKYPDMRPTPATREAETLRERADAIERDEGFKVMHELNHKHLSMLERCNAEIRSRPW
jgi:hypothetical protein